MKKFLLVIIGISFFTNIALAECIDDNCEKKYEIETPTGLNYTTPGFDFVCYNSCKERNDESLCRKQCTLALE